MLCSGEEILQREPFKKLVSIAYRMRAPQVYKLTLEDQMAIEMTKLLNKESVLFCSYRDNLSSGIGEQASRQVVMYPVLGWSTHSAYYASTFAESNIQAWKDAQEWIQTQGSAPAEFLGARDILRRNVVQLVMLVFWDGPRECMLDNSVTSVSEDLARHFMKSPLPGLEMVVRLCSKESDWNDGRQSSSMIISLREELDECECRLCDETDKRRELTNERYQAKPKADDVGDELTEAVALVGRVLKGYGRRLSDNGSSQFSNRNFRAIVTPMKPFDLCSGIGCEVAVLVATSRKPFAKRSRPVRRWGRVFDILFGRPHIYALPTFLDSR